MGDHRRYKQRNFDIAQRLVALRRRTGLTQEVVASEVGVAVKSVRNWEGGISYPTGLNLQKLIALYLDKDVFEAGREREETRELWEQLQKSTRHQISIFDEQWFSALLKQSQLRRTNREALLDRLPPDIPPGLPNQNTHTPLLAGATEASDPAGFLPFSQRHREDWGEAIDVSIFYGRMQELADLERWALTDRCRVIALLGMGGIGKTTLAIKFAQQVAARFDIVIWRSLRNAPSLQEIVTDCIQIISDQQLPLPENRERQISLLIKLLQARRCLLIFDNMETILRERAIAGDYRQGYEDYNGLVMRLATVKHQSCLLLTGREQLAEMSSLQGLDSPVRLQRVTGLALPDSRELLSSKKLIGDAEAWSELIERYSGNPLVLKIITEKIRELFGGDIEAFLAEGHITFHGVHQLLDQQFERLTALEQEVMYWLAIERDLTSLEDLRAAMVYTTPREDLLEALGSLYHRCLIERGERGAVFTLQPVVLEYVTDRLIKQMCQEIVEQRPVLLLRYGVLKAQAKEYIRNSQLQLIVQALLNRLLIQLRNKQRLEEHLKLLIPQLRALPMAEQGYGGGNIITLLAHLNGDVGGLDCSYLMVRQAVLHGVEAQDATFEGSDLTDSVFLEAMDSAASVAFSANGQYVAGGMDNGQIRIWRAANGQPLLDLQGHTKIITALAFNPESTLLVSGGYDGQAKVWEISSGQCVSILQGHTRWVTSVAFHPTGKFVATGSEDRSIRLWDPTNGHCLKIWHEQDSEVSSVAFSSNGQLLAGGYADGIVKVWDFTSKQCVWNIAAHHNSAVLSLAFSPDGMLLGSGGQDATIMVRQAYSGEYLSSLSGHTEEVRSITFNAEGLLASGSFDRTIKLWQIRPIREAAQCLDTLHGHAGWIMSTAFGPDGMLVSGDHDGVIKMWQIPGGGKGGRCLWTLHGYSHLIHSIALSPDGNLLVSAESNGTVRMWETTSGQCLSILSRQSSEAYAVVFRPDGQLFASSAPNKTIKIWDSTSRRCLRTLKGHQGQIWSLAFSPDGHFLISGSVDTTIKRWEVDSGRCLTTFHGHSNQVWSLACSPDGALLASGDITGTVKLWEIDSGQCLKTLSGSPQAILALTFTPDGTRLLSSNAQDLVAMWDVKSGHCLKTILAIRGAYWPRAVTFSADGSLLVTGSPDQTMKVWDANSGALLRTFPCYASQLWSVSWSADQRLLASGTEDGTIRLWEIQTGKCLMTLYNDRPYERMNISCVIGITEAQKVSLKALGAIEKNDEFRVL